MRGHGYARQIAVCATGMLALSMCGSKYGTEAEGGGGYGRFGISSCGVRRNYEETDYRAAIRHETERGLSVGGEVIGHRRELLDLVDGTPGPEEPAEGSTKDTLFLTARAGLHGDWIGVEGGPVFIFDGKTMEPGESRGLPGTNGLRDDQLIVLPSAEVWIGNRNGVYGWANAIHRVETLRPLVPAGAGLGLDTEWLRARAGLTLQGAIAEVAVPVGGPEAPVCVGVRGLVSEADSYWVGGTLSYRFGSAPAPRTRHDPPPSPPVNLSPDPGFAPPAPTPTAAPTPEPEPETTATPPP